MTVTSLVAAVVPCTGKFIKNNLMFLKEEKIYYKMVCFVFTLSQPVMNRVVKLEFAQTKK